jgi:NAD(P)-dependent dehydrogenase (short-subunit alcohol dehydrogenase family)
MAASRSYVVTGSASGIGRATKELLEERGARVIGVDLRDADLTADLGTAAGRAALVTGVSAACGGSLDAVVACAGVGGGEGEPASIVRVNYFGALATLEGLRPLLADASAPRAVVVASIAVLWSQPQDPVLDACLAGDEDAAVAVVAGDRNGRRAYAATKRAVARRVRRAAPTPAWARAGIALNAVAPAVVDTPMSAYLFRDDGARDLEERVPMPLTGVAVAPRHVAALLAWLASPENALVTGQLVFADGAYEAQAPAATTSGSGGLRVQASERRSSTSGASSASASTTSISAFRRSAVATWSFSASTSPMPSGGRASTTVRLSRPRTRSMRSW